jgi:P-type Cu2+ transporter
VTRSGGWSLGKAGWTGEGGGAFAAETSGSELRENGELRAMFRFRESLRPGAADTLRSLERNGISLHILSGDHPEKVRHMAAALEIPTDQAFGGLSPNKRRLAWKPSTARTPSIWATARTTRSPSTRPT